MLGRVIVLLLLVAVLALGGIIWFDYLTLIDAKTVLAPLYKFVGKDGRSQPKAGQDEYLSIDAERLAVRLEQLELRDREMDNRQRDMDTRYNEIEQIAQDLDERQKQLDDRENSLSVAAEDSDNKNRNIDQNARLLNGMQPERAVGIMAQMDDQDVIDVLRKTEEIAKAEGTTSIVSYWLSLMEPARAAELQRKMVGRPQSL
jgi:flagellar protein FlbB